MAWKRDLTACVVAAGLSGALFHAGTGLHPVWWLTWLAPLPVLLVAPRVGAVAAAGTAFAAWVAGETGLWSYYTSQKALSQPVPLVVALFVVTGLVFAGVIVGARALLRSGHLLAATCFVPAAWTVVEFAVSALTPNGLFWSLAYTQLDALPVVQIASLVGPWGITFLVLALPAALAALCAPSGRVRGRLRLSGAVLVVAVLVIGYGTVRLRAPRTDPPGPMVGVFAVAQPFDPVPVSTPAGEELLGRYLVGVRSLAALGARVLVLPEKVFAVDGRTSAALTVPLAALAAEHHVDIVVGLVLVRDGMASNVAWMFTAAGGEPVEYDKHHLVPVLEDAFTPGKNLVLLPGPRGRLGVTICKDMDYPGLLRRYSQRGATAMLVPAWDFDQDAWLHSRMAVLRGVENGFPLVRAGRSGAVTVSDPYGRVLAESRTQGRPDASGIAVLPRSAAATPYAALGDWFPWACVALLLVVAANAGRRRSQPGTGPSTSPYQLAGSVSST
jgi:apolipoprotein N-acyltransferase